MMKLHLNCTLATLASVTLLTACDATRADITITPGDANIFNVRDFGAKGDGKTDDTAAIQKAMNALIEPKRAKLGKPIWSAGHHTLYFPDGTYLVSAPMTFGDSADALAPDRKFAGRLLQQSIHVKGETRAGTTIRLRDGAMPDAARPQTVFSFFSGPWSNTSFANTMEDLTIDAGRNPGAIALNYHNNNLGYVRRVTLRGEGTCGLNLGSNLSGIGLISDVEVRGFDYGIINGGGFRICYVLEDIALANQKKAGIWSRDKGLSVRRLTSDNRVPALLQRSAYGGGREDNGLVVLTDSQLRGGAAGGAAVQNESGWLLARGIQTSGYGVTLRDHGRDVKMDKSGQHTTGDPKSLWKGEEKTLNLPVEAAPNVPQDPASQWAIVDANAQEDDTLAVQAAIDSGKTTVFLRRGEYQISDTLILRGAVRRFNGNWSMFNISAIAAQAKPVFRIADGTAPAVVIEALDMRPGSGARGANSKAWFIGHESSRTLILRDLFYSGAAAYRNTVPGKLFVESVFTDETAQPDKMLPRAGWEFTRQRVWARAINHEGSFPHFLNDGGQVWIMGFKAGEGHGPFIVTRNGGQTEVLGGIFNNLARPEIYPKGVAAVEIENSDVSISAMETSDSNRPMAPHPVMVREVRDGVTRELKSGDVPPRQNKLLNARALPFFVTRGKK